MNSRVVLLVVCSLIVAPFAVAHDDSNVRVVFAPPGVAVGPEPSEVLAISELVADWQLSHPAKHPPTDWTQATGYAGFMALASVSSSPRFHDAMLRMAEANAWQLGNDPGGDHANELAVGQTFAELYFLHQDPRMIAPLRDRLDWVLAHPTNATLDPDLTRNPSRGDTWWYCDSLFMAAPTWLRLSIATGKKNYMDFMVEQWWKASDYLYAKDEHLFFRDSRYFDRRETNGRKVFWSRGNGLVMAGLLRVLQYLPPYHPSRNRFLQQFCEMADKVVTVQQSDGFWRASLLDADDYPLPETSGTAFFTYALAWGVNNNLLKREKFAPAILKAWHALVSSVSVDGRLIHVQPIGADPQRFDENHTDVYGVGAFLLAGSEVYQLVSGNIKPTTAPLSRQRITQVAALLPEQPEGLGRPIRDRVFWKQLATQPPWRDLITRAATLIATPLAPTRDDLYLEFTRTGDRSHWEGVEYPKRDRLVTLVLAECLENKGRFLPAIDQLIVALSVERTWVHPAHDAKLANFKGTAVEIDLNASNLAWNLATSDYLLGDKIHLATRTILRENVQRRVIDPYRAMIRGEHTRMGWMTAPMNWNAVCLAGVTGAALAELSTRVERAEFVVAAEKYSQAFLAGLTGDGYNPEGIDYWNYGYGHFVLLAETVRLATSGRLDLLAQPEAQPSARFGTRMQIINGVWPAFGDSAVFGLHSKPLAPLMTFLNRRFNLDNGYDHADLALQLNSEDSLGFPLSAIMIFQRLCAPDRTVKAQSPKPPLRDYFETVGVLIGRPMTRDGIGVALKGSDQDGAHGHLDAGSYVVVSGTRPILLDPGKETYTSRTFSERRFESKLLNSFGHPVPMVAGQLQANTIGKQAVRCADLSNSADTLVLDLTSAYSVHPLKNLTRTFIYSREGSGSLSVIDQVSFTVPQNFGTALITLGTWRQQTDGSLIIRDGKEALRVAIDTGKRAFSIRAETIVEDATVKPTRIGINLKESVMDATVTLKISPVQSGGKWRLPANLRAHRTHCLPSS